MCRRLTLTVVWCAACLLLLAGSVSRAADWSQWRGPNRDGHVAGFTAPATWPSELKRLWKVEVGQGHSSPVVVGDRVFVFSRQEEEEVVRALALADGRTLWSGRYPAPYEMNPSARSHGKGPKSTPLAAGGRVFTLGISGILSGWEAETGERLWQHEFSKTFEKTSPLFGTATSPMIDREMVIAHVGGHNDGALTAFDPETGQVKWQWDEDGPAYTSPIVATLDGTRQVITQSQSACVGVDPTDGSLLWSMPFTTQYVMNIVTPVLSGDLVVFSGFKKGTAAYRLEKGEAKWLLTEVWRNPDFSMFMSSPVLTGKRLVGFAQDNRGQLFCLDVAAGKTIWSSDGRMGDNAALVVAGDTVLALTTNAELLAVDPAAEEFQPLARYKVAETPTYAHPVVLGGRILVKDKDALALWTLGE